MLFWAERRGALLAGETIVSPQEVMSSNCASPECKWAWHQLWLQDISHQIPQNKSDQSTYFYVWRSQLQKEKCSSHLLQRNLHRGLSSTPSNTLGISWNAECEPELINPEWDQIPAVVLQHLVESLPRSCYSGRHWFWHHPYNDWFKVWVSTYFWPCLIHLGEFDSTHWPENSQMLSVICLLTLKWPNYASPTNIYWSVMSPSYFILYNKNHRILNCCFLQKSLYFNNVRK